MGHEMGLQCLAGTEIILDPRQSRFDVNAATHMLLRAVSLMLGVQACWSKPSCAERLNASAATVLSRRVATTLQAQ